MKISIYLNKDDNGFTFKQHTYAKGEKANIEMLDPKAVVKIHPLFAQLVNAGSPEGIVSALTALEKLSKIKSTNSEKNNAFLCPLNDYKIKHT